MDELQTTQSQLLEIEGRNVSLRITKLEEVINETTKQFVSRLSEEFEMNDPIPQCDLNIDVKKRLKFISKFRGVKVRRTRDMDYSLQKGLNWLNGKRAKEYSKNLFIDFLDCVHNHATLIAHLFENDNSRNYHFLFTSLRFKILAGVLEAYFDPRSEYATSKPLICYNSLKYPDMAHKLRDFGLNVNVDVKKIPDVFHEYAEKYYKNYLDLKKQQKNALLPSVPLMPFSMDDFNFCFCPYPVRQNNLQPVIQSSRECSNTLCALRMRQKDNEIKQLKSEKKDLETKLKNEKLKAEKLEKSLKDVNAKKQKQIHDFHLKKIIRASTAQLDVFPFLPEIDLFAPFDPFDPLVDRMDIDDSSTHVNSVNFFS